MEICTSEGACQLVEILAGGTMLGVPVSEGPDSPARSTMQHCRGGTGLPFREADVLDRPVWLTDYVLRTEQTFRNGLEVDLAVILMGKFFAREPLVYGYDEPVGIIIQPVGIPLCVV